MFAACSITILRSSSAAARQGLADMALMMLVSGTRSMRNVSDPDWQRVASKIDRGDITGSSLRSQPSEQFGLKKRTI